MRKCDRRMQELLGELSRSSPLVGVMQIAGKRNCILLLRKIAKGDMTFWGGENAPERLYLLEKVPILAKAVLAVEKDESELWEALKYVVRGISVSLESLYKGDTQPDDSHYSDDTEVYNSFEYFPGFPTNGAN
nr:hypothetical protein BaRGS_011486 [Batillaria attramentaria]